MMLNIKIINILQMSLSARETKILEQANKILEKKRKLEKK